MLLACCVHIFPIRDGTEGGRSTWTCLGRLDDVKYPHQQVLPCSASGVLACRLCVRSRARVVGQGVRADSEKHIASSLSRAAAYTYVLVNIQQTFRPSPLEISEHLSKAEYSRFHGFGAVRTHFF